jgi:hypothetical protein
VATKKAKMAVMKNAASKKFDEKGVARVPAGQPGGGQFASSGSGGKASTKLSPGDLADYLIANQHDNNTEKLYTLAAKAWKEDEALHAAYADSYKLASAIDDELVFKISPEGKKAAAAKLKVDKAAAMAKQEAVKKAIEREAEKLSEADEKKQWGEVKNKGEEDIAEHFAKMAGIHFLDKDMRMKGAPPPDKKGFAGLCLYTRHGDQRMNGLLRTGKAPQGNDEKVKMMVESAVHGLNQLPDHSGVVHRGMVIDNDIADKYQEGLVIQEKGFTSTSKKIGVAEGFSKPKEWKTAVIMSITSKKGKDISNLSEYKFEEEVLFPPNTKFRVKSRKSDGLRTLIELEEVD